METALDRPPPAPRPRHMPAPLFDEKLPSPKDLVPPRNSSSRSLVSSPMVTLDSYGIGRAVSSPKKRALSPSSPLDSRKLSKHPPTILIPNGSLSPSSSRSSPSGTAQSAHGPDRSPKCERPQLLVSYCKCSHTTRVLLSPNMPLPTRPELNHHPGPSTIESGHSASPNTRTAGAWPSSSDNFRPDTSSTPSTPVLDLPSTPVQEHRLPYACIDCSKAAAKSQESKIRDRYRNEIAKVEYWMETFNPHPNASWVLHHTLQMAKFMHEQNLRDVKGRRDFEIRKAWAEYEECHGARPDSGELSSVGSSLDCMMDDSGIPDLDLSDISIDHLENDEYDKDLDAGLYRGEAINNAKRAHLISKIEELETRQRSSANAIPGLEEASSISEKVITSGATHKDEGYQSAPESSESANCQAYNKEDQMNCASPRLDPIQGTQGSSNSSEDRDMFSHREKDEKSPSPRNELARRQWDAGDKDAYGRYIDQEIKKMKERVQRRKINGQSTREDESELTGREEGGLGPKVPKEVEEPEADTSCLTNTADHAIESMQQSSDMDTDTRELAAQEKNEPSNEDLEKQIRSLQLTRRKSTFLNALKSSCPDKDT